ncbi:MAG: 16S rRNA (guanine(966)-N(2))-methyltransferase RsmD [Proteobacteria bacterium]|nr:16S rRNA (guanine(966)-N(2))-methyltransferase RsmD [Pseudomonadota bacterium]
MRVIGGAARGRRLFAPKGSVTRPTADRVRESVFNVLAHGAPQFDFAGAAVLDVFAGAGALGIEALSRGAQRATFIDRDREAIQCIRRNLGALGRIDDAFVLQLDAAKIARPPGQAAAPFGLAFLDPPYGQNLAGPTLARLNAHGWLAPGAIAVVELGADEVLTAPAGLDLLDERRYGVQRVLVFRLRERIEQSAARAS